MRNNLLKSMQRNQLVDMMYIAKDGEISKRRVKIIKISGDTFQAFCLKKQEKRTFLIDNILAFVPFERKENAVI